jgi:hypothetical protein
MDRKISSIDGEELTICGVDPPLEWALKSYSVPATTWYRNAHHGDVLKKKGAIGALFSELETR